MRTHDSARLRRPHTGLVAERDERGLTPSVPPPPCVVVVDDDALIRQGIRAALKDLCDTVGLSSGDELEAFLENVRPDLVVLDVGLPGRDGFELCASLRRRASSRSLPVLFLTARAGDASYERFLAVKGDAYLTKPVRREELVEAVLRLLPFG